MVGGQVSFCHWEWICQATDRLFITSLMSSPRPRIQPSNIDLKLQKILFGTLVCVLICFSSWFNIKRLPSYSTSNLRKVTSGSKEGSDWPWQICSFIII